MASEGESERRGLPARVGWVIGPSGEAGSLVRRDGERTACFASFHGRAWYLYADPYTSSVVLCGCAADEDDARAAAESALWARDGFGVGRVYGARLDAAEVSVGGKPVSLPGLPGLWRITDADHRRGAMVVDAVRVPFDTQADADAAPLTHALDAEGNALCPYDPATLAYVSPRAERVTCPVCVEKVQATAEAAPREPSAPTDAGELARLLPDLPHRIAYARQAARDEEPLDVAIRGLADGCKLLLAERERLISDHDGAHEEARALRARVAELEAERATSHMAWTCTTCGISGTTEMLADDGAGPVCPECRQARHLCMHEPAGYRVAALLAELKRMREEGDGGMREAIDAVREHLGAPTTA